MGSFYEKYKNGVPSSSKKTSSSDSGHGSFYNKWNKIKDGGTVSVNADHDLTGDLNAFFRRERELASANSIINNRTSRINNWITGDRREDISSDIDAYERALEALKRYGKDTKAASEWIAGVRDDNNRSVRQNLIDDIGEARNARKGTLWEFAKQTAASIGATSRGDTEKASEAQRAAISALNRRSTSKEQQREAEEALAAHREKYGQNLVASEILEQAYKDEDEALKIIQRNTRRNTATGATELKDAQKKLKEAQATITELGGKVNASAARGAAKSYVGNTGAGLAYGLKGQDTRKQDSNIAAGEAALSEALENAVMSGDRQEEQRLRTMVDAINRPGADKATILAEFLPGIAEVTDEVSLRDRRADLQRQALGNKGYAALKEMAESGSAELEASKAGKSEVEKVLIDVAVQGGNMAADAAIGLATGGAMTPMALRSYGAGVIAAESAGASQRDAMLYGMASAGVEMLTEKLFDGFLGVYGEGVGDHMTDYVIGKLAKTEAGQAAWGMLFSAGGEAAEEFISGIVDPMFTSIYNGKTVAENYSETEMGDIMYDALIGGILGFMGGSVEGLTRRQSGAANFFRNAAEAGLSPRQAAQVWAETGMEVPDNRTVRNMSQEVRSAVVEEGKQSAKGTKSRELAEAKSGKKLRISDVQAQTIANNLAIRREEADAELASKDVKNQTFDEKKAGSVELDVQGRTIIDGKINDSGVAYTLKKMGFAEAVAEDMARQYQPGTMTEGQYAMAMNQAYQMARTAIPATEVSRDSLVQYLTPAQRDMAIGYGSFNRMNAAKERQEAIRAQLAAKPIKGAGKVLNDTGREINIDKLNAVQKRGLQVAQILTKVTSNNVHVFESVEKGGKRVLAHDVGPHKAGDEAPNGWYDHTTGDIYVDINAGERGDGTILYTLGHEYTHFVKEWSPEKFDKLAEFLFENADISIEAAIQKQIDKASMAGRKIDRDKAMEEVVADAMEAMLSDTNAAEKIIELRNRDKGLWEKLKELITKIRNAVRAAYKDFAPDSHEGLMLKRMDESLTEKLSTLFAEGVADAAENYSRAAEYVSVEEQGEHLTNAESFADSAVQISYQIRPPYNDGTKAFNEFADSLNEEARYTFDLFYGFYQASRITGGATNMAGKRVRAINIAAPYVSVDEWNQKLAEDKQWAEAAQKLANFLPDEVRREMRMNADGTLNPNVLETEFRMKTSLMQRLVDALPLESIDSQYKLGDKVVDLSTGRALQSVGGEAYRRALTEATRKLYADGKLKKVSIGTMHKDRWGSLGFLASNGKTGASGDLTTLCPQMMYNRGCFYCYRRAAMESGVNNKLVAQSVWYTGEILRIRDDDVAALNSNGGLRIQSFGDWMPQFSAQLADILYDAELRGLQVKIITKEPSMIQYIAKLREQGIGKNLYFNLSADYAIEKGPAASNSDGKTLNAVNPERPFMRDAQGTFWWKRAMTVEEAAKFRAKYPWVNTRIVATDVNEFIRGLKDPTVDVVTGYHGNIREYERVDSTTGENKVIVEALGDAGMPRFVLNKETMKWETEYAGKTKTHQNLASAIEQEGLQAEYYAKTCCITGRCATCNGKCGKMSRSFEVKNATNRDAESVAYWQEHMTKAEEAESGRYSFSVRGNWKKWSEKEPTYVKNNRNGVFITDEFVDFATESNYSRRRMEKVFDMNEREYQTFSRTLSDLTMGMTDGEERGILIYASQSDSIEDSFAYLFHADGYRKGSVLAKINQESNIQLIDELFRRFSDGNDRNARVLSRWNARSWDEYLRHSKYFESIRRRGTASEIAVVDGAARNTTDEIGSDTGGNEYLEEPVEGAMVYDPNVIPIDDISFSLRDQTTTDRYVLTNAEGQNDTEIRILAKYREESGRMAGLEDTLEAQRATLKELLAMKPRDTEAVKNQREEIRKTEARIGVEQGILKRMEESATLRRVLKRERENDILEGYERGRFDQGWETAPKTRREMERVASEEFLKGYERGRFDQGLTMAEQQRRAMEYAEKKTGDRINRLEARLAEAEENERRRVQQLKNYRQNQGRKELLRKIGKTTKELNDWLAHPSKDKHIPSDLIGVVVEALDAVNMDTVNAEERLAILDRRIAEVDKSLSVTKEYKNRQRLEAEREKLVRQQNTISKQGYRMRENLSKLQSVYNAIRESDDPVLAGAYDENISAKIQEVWEAVGDTPIREMSVEQLQTVYDLYRMVSKTVRNANNAFLAGKNATIEGLANSVMGELSSKDVRGEVSKFRLGFEKLAWAELKPVYAFKTIGSDTMTELFHNIRKGEDTYGRDVDEANSFFLREADKHGMNGWDMDEKFSFTSTSGLDFELTLGDIMSIYAYSKREQALDHLAKGGIVLQPDMDKKGAFAKVSENATAYNLSPEILMEITGKLTAPQKAFVDAMQRYLSTDMGAKGNDVSMELYDVKLFNEEDYFPLRSAKAYMARAKEQQGEVKIKNSGFTKAVTPNASNPIVLQPFMEVWSEHVSDMAMYHAFTLPLEDFYRVYNYKTKADTDNAIRSVNADIQNIYGKAAIDYVDTLLRDINGGAMVKSSFGVVNRAFSKFKKASVMASASVVAQQPTSVVRAFAYIPAKYFVGEKMTTENQMKVWDEVKKYAPIAVIKEIGSFDQNAGKRTVDWITQRKYDGFGEKAKAFVTDSNFRDDVFGYGAEKADQFTWCRIWQAAKRMVAQTTDLRGEALRQRAAEIFTEAIVNTQVYDSVLSRSQVMRSKGGLDQMITAFMGEPTTTLNMLYDAYFLEGARNGNYKRAAQLVGAVTSSVIINAMVKSLVTASRDDDDEKTWLEKYIADFASSSVGGLLRVDQLIPYARDIGNIVIDGYDVERSDVSIYNDLVQVVEKLWSVEESEEIAGAAVDVVATFANFFGIPGTNIVRELRAIGNVYGMATGGEKNTMMGFENAIREGLIGGVSRRLDNRKANNQQLYEAIMAGDSAHTERVMGRYETQKKADSDLRKYFREADPRVKEAALARYEGRTADYERIINDILDEGKLSRNVVVEAIRAEEEKLDEDTVSTETRISSLYTQGDLVQAMKTGDNPLAHRIRQDIVDTAVANGKTVKEAQRQFKSNASGAAKEAFIDGSITANTARAILKNYSGKSQQDANDVVEAWKFEKQNGWAYSSRGTEYKDGNITRSQLKTAMTTYGNKTNDEAELAIKVYEWEMDGISNASEPMIRDYTKEGVEAAGISREVWAKAWYIKYNTKGVDADGDGKTDTNSALKNCMPLINELPISAEQKTFIATRFWSKANVNKYKTW